MNDQLKIAMRIAGTKLRQGGFVPLATVGVLPAGEADNMDRVPLISETPSYIIKHTADYVLYLLMDLRVKSVDSSAFGVLSIALSISKGAQLANGKSPYTLLKELYEAFLRKYMMPSAEGYYVFLNRDVDGEEFRAIVNRYPLEARRSPYVEMTGGAQGVSGMLCVPEDKMEEFFRDTHYPEFARFKELEVGSACSTTPGLENIQIPRPVVYRVIVNGKENGVRLTLPSDTFRSNFRNTQYSEFTNVSFSLQELLSAPNQTLEFGQSRVVLDAANAVIRCTIHEEKFSYRFVFDWQWNGLNEDEQDEVKSYFIDGKVKLLVGGVDLGKYIETPDLIRDGEYGMNVKAEVNPRQTDKYKFSVSSHIDYTRRLYPISIIVQKRPASPPVTLTYGGERQGQTTSRGQQNAAVSRGRTNLPVATKNEQKAEETDKKPKPNNKLKYAVIAFGVVCIAALVFLGIRLLKSEPDSPVAVKTDPQSELITRNDSIQNKQDSIPEDTTHLIAKHDTLPAETIEDQSVDAQLGKDKMLKDAEKKAAEDKKRKEEAKKQAENVKKQQDAVEKQEKNKRIDEAKDQILSLLNKGEDWGACSGSKYWNDLPKTYQNAVEAVLYQKINPKYDATLKRKIENKVKRKKYKTWNDVLDAQIEVNGVINEYLNNK